MYTTNSQGFPVISMDPTGNLVVVWEVMVKTETIGVSLLQWFVLRTTATVGIT
jgi:hypothetical protein